MNLNVQVRSDAARIVVMVSGEVDVSNADVLRDAIDKAVCSEGVQVVEVDMAQVPYIDSTGIGVLVGGAHRAQDAGASFSLVGAQDNVVRILGMLGVDEVINIKS